MLLLQPEMMVGLTVLCRWYLWLVLPTMMLVVFSTVCIVLCSLPPLHAARVRRKVIPLHTLVVGGRTYQVAIVNDTIIAMPVAAGHKKNCAAAA